MAILAADRGPRVGGADADDAHTDRAHLGGPRFGAAEALELLQARQLDIPLIVIADRPDPEAAVRHVKRGAANYLARERLGGLAAALREALEEKGLRDQRRAADERLRQSEHRYRQLVDDAPDAIFVTRDDRIVYVNGAGIRLLGAAGPADVTGRPFLDFVHPDDRAAVGRRSAEVLDHRRPARLVEEQIVRLDGEVVEVETIVALCLDEGLPALEHVLRDVADRRRIQEQARRHLAETAHVTRLQTMGELMSEVSHEISQPLYAISNFAEASLQLLRSQGTVGGEIVAWLDQIARQANRAGEIIRRIGRFVRKSPAKLAPADVNEIIRAVVGLLSFGERMEAVDLQLRLADTPPVNVDRVQIEQVLVNLLRNALEAMAGQPAPRRPLVVRTELLSSGAVRIAVRDEGRGLSERELNRLFEPFFTTKANGMGMGLSISHSIVEAHGGHMEAIPNPDRGLTFQFTLPVATQEAAHGQ